MCLQCFARHCSGDRLMSASSMIPRRSCGKGNSLIWPHLIGTVLAQLAHHAVRAGDVPEMHNALEKFNIRNLQHALHTGLHLSANVTELQHSGDWIDVSWQGVQDPQDDDYVALYAPADANVYKTSPVKYQWAVKAPSHRAEGAGSIRWLIVRNMIGASNATPGCAHSTHAAGSQSELCCADSGC